MRVIYFAFIIFNLFAGRLLAAESGSIRDAAQFLESDQMVHYVVEDSFDQIKELLKIAISERGIKISNTSYISNMLQRTRKDVGASKDIFVSAEAIEFCSATLSRAMMEAMPHSIIFCPYIIYIYVLADNPAVVNVGFRKLPLMGSAELKAAISDINQLLNSIIKEAIE